MQEKYVDVHCAHFFCNTGFVAACLLIPLKVRLINEDALNEKTYQPN